MGTAYALKLVLKDIDGFKKYKEFYFLKLDIKKYFYNISHEKLKELIKDDLNEEEFKLISTIIDSTDKEYVNGCIEYLENRYNTKLPKCKKRIWSSNRKSIISILSSLLSIQTTSLYNT